MYKRSETEQLINEMVKSVCRETIYEKQVLNAKLCFGSFKSKEQQDIALHILEEALVNQSMSNTKTLCEFLKDILIPLSVFASLCGLNVALEQAGVSIPAYFRFLLP